MPTWVVGDVHGCAAELAQLVEELSLGAGDGLVLLGDLFHGGPDPLGVARLCAHARARFVLGNHEHAMLERLGLAPARDDVAPGRIASQPYTEYDLRGDAGRPLCLAPERAGELLGFLGGHSGYWLESSALPQAGTTPDGREFWMVHAGLTPGRRPRDSRVRDLVYAARAGGGSRNPWHATYAGPELVLFGHTVYGDPLVVQRDARTVAIGLDTGVLVGGWLTAYSPELDAFRRVRARRAYVER